jgi:hypothetical protein
MLGVVGLSLAAACDDVGNASRRSDADSSQRTASVPQSPATAGQPSCGGDLCLEGTAFGHSIDTDPGWVVEANWILFVEPGDTTRVEVRPLRGATASTVLRAPGNSAQQIPEVVSTASGVLWVFSVLDPSRSGGDTIPYKIQVHRRGAGTRTRPAGSSAGLTIESASANDRFSVVPLSLVGGLASREQWAVPRGAFRVALLQDSLYEVCRLACVAPDTVRLVPGGTALKRY